MKAVFYLTSDSRYYKTVFTTMNKLRITYMFVVKNIVYLSCAAVGRENKVGENTSLRYKV